MGDKRVGVSLVGMLRGSKSLSASGSNQYEYAYYPYPAYRDGHNYRDFYYGVGRTEGASDTRYDNGYKQGGKPNDPALEKSSKSEGNYGAYMSGHGKVECCPLVVKPLVLLAILAALAAATAFLNVLITMNLGRRKRRKRRSLGEGWQESLVASFHRGRERE